MNIQRARDLRKHPTEAEHRLWRRLQRRQIADAKFRRQQPLGPYIVDFVCLEHRLIVEIDGGQHAGQATADERRTLWLEQRGFRVLRFWNNEVLAHTDDVAQAIFNFIRSQGVIASTPHLNPPPQGGRRDQEPAQGRGRHRSGKHFSGDWDSCARRSLK